MMKTNNQIFYYGLGGADKNYRSLNFEFVDSDRYSIWIENKIIDNMLNRNPGIVEIYAIDNRPGLKWDFTESIREGSVESCQIFKDILRNEGKKVYPRNK